MIVGGTLPCAAKVFSTSSPLLPGMRMSSNTTSGLVFGITSSDEAPSWHSATTWISGESSNSERMPCRTSVWSSTRHTEIIQSSPQSSTCQNPTTETRNARAPKADGRPMFSHDPLHGQRRFQREAPFAIGPDCQLPAHFGQPLAHAPEAVARDHFTRTAAVVVRLQHQHTACAFLEAQPKMARSEER